MATNLRQLPPPIETPISGANNIVTEPWGEFFRNLFRFNAVMWRDINLGSVALAKAASNQPDLVTLASTNILAYAFAGAVTTEELHGAFELQHDYKEGTDLSPHIHWYPTDTGTGNVKWFLDYFISQPSANLTGTLSVVDAAPGVAWEQQIAVFPSIAGATLTTEAQIHFRIYRVPTDAADTYASDAVLGTVGIHYQVDTKGTLQRSTK